MTRLLRSILRFLLAATLLLVIGFGFFLASLPTANRSNAKADAIVVLTGSDRRVERGFSLLARDIAPRMFVSGVYDKATHDHVFHSFSTLDKRRYAELKSRIDLGYDAETTVGNAREVAQWIARQKEPVRRVRLVTARYHMPRALCELRRTLPDIELVPDPAFPMPFDREDWWQTRIGAFRTASEYFKLIYAYLRPLLPNPARLDRLPRALRFDKDLYDFHNH